jgi:Bacterial Ig-like domain (group 2)
MRWICLLFLMAAMAACSKSKPAAPVVVPPPPVVIHVSGVTTAGAVQVLLPLDSTYQVSVVVSPANSTNPKLSYTSSAASVLKVDSTGLLTGVGLGVATMTVASVDNPQLTITIQVVVVKNYAVYAAGYGPDQYALLWMNDSSYVELQPGVGGGSSSATAMVMSGSDLYVGGTSLNNEGWNIATWWKNGVVGEVSDPTLDYNNNITAICVSGSSIFLGGYDTWSLSNPSWAPGYINHAMWTASYYSVNAGTAARNLVEPDTTDISTVVYGMAVSGSDVYLAGGFQSQNGNRIATYWKNNQNGAVALASGGDWSEAEGIAVQGADVYVTGYDQCPNYGCIPTVKLWKNNEETVVNLSSGAVNAFSSCLAVNDTAQYIGGYQQTVSGVKQAMLWRVEGQNVSSIPLSDGVTDAVVKAIAVSGNDIFLGGYQVNASTGYQVATYWRVYGSVVAPPVKFQAGGYFGASGSFGINAIVIK